MEASKTQEADKSESNLASLEAQWQSQAERRRRIVKFMLLVVVVSILFLVGLWFWITQPMFSSVASSSARTVDPARLQAHVRKLSVELGPRDESHIENLDRVAAYIKDEFSRTTSIVLEQPYRVQGKSYRNVIARFGPESEERIVVGAHYDTAGPLPGADDNASGVAGLIELARLLGEHPPPLRVELVAFTLEEPPYFRTTGMGSSVHALSLRNENVRVRAMFSLEMIGCFSDAPKSQRFPIGLFGAFYPLTGNFISVVGRLSDWSLVRRTKSAMRGASPLPVYSVNAPSFVTGVDFSDQLNYWEAGYSAVMITDTAFFRNRNYHTEDDTEEKLDYGRMAMVVEGVYAAVVELARE
ncbi:MAG TPA: M28 family peptidase [Pyrinomonadaceae bacterium]|nr:M28 family peptidase [Pyrinomonadaceae bacterium]